MPANPNNLWKPTKQVDQYVGANPELAAIAAQPQAQWVAEGDTPQNILNWKAEAGDKTIVFAVYAAPGRDAGGFSAGGFPNRAAFTTWLTGIKNAIGSHPSVVVVEPDALGLLPTDPTARAEHIETLRQAVTILSTLTNAEVYMEAPTWVPVNEMAALLQSVDVSKIRGFCLNVSAFNAQQTMYDYGNAVVAQLDTLGITGKQFVIDSSRNGRGVLTEAERPMASPWLDTGQAWCNPPGRRLGISPRTITDQGACRATLWIKGPGESDGTFPTLTQSDYFGSSAPAAGVFWLPLARDLLGLAPVETSGGTPAATGTVSDVMASFDVDWGSFTTRNTEATLISGKARIPLTASYHRISTTAAYKLTGGAITTRLYMAVGAAATGAADTGSTFSIQSATTGTRAVIVLLPLSNQIRLGFEAGYWDEGNATLPYDPVTMAWVRIREAAGQAYMETSPDGATWTVRRQIATPAWAAAATSSVNFSTYSNIAAGYAEIDNVNMPPATAPKPTGYRLTATGWVPFRHRIIT